MKILWISGDDDYAVIDFENSPLYDQPYTQLFELAWNSPKHTHSYDDGERRFDIEALEFGSVDSKFVDFVKDRLVDYDQAKNEDFFVVEE